MFKHGNNWGAQLLFLLSLCLLQQLLPQCAFGLNPHQRISQYGHTAWRLQDGFLSGAPGAMAQTADGYLWVGTATGLFRFDGIRFTRFVPPAGKSLSSPEIENILAAKDGSLWFSTDGVLQQWRDGDLFQYSAGGRQIGGIVQANDGTIWTGLNGTIVSDPVCKVERLKLHCYGNAEGIATADVYRISEDSTGHLWFSSDLEVESWKAGDHQHYPMSALQGHPEDSASFALSPDPDGSMWVYSRVTGHGGGLQHLVDGHFSPIVLPGFNSSELSVSDFLRDRSGALWIGTPSQGVYRIYQGRVDRYGARDGLSSDDVNCLFEDREGDIWVGTPAGLDKFRDLPVVTFSTLQGLRSGNVNAVLASSDGTVWVVDGKYLESIRSGKIAFIDKAHGLPGTEVKAIMEDHLGRLWVGMDDGLFIRSGNKFTAVKQAGGAPVRGSRFLAEEADGTMWDRIDPIGEFFRWKPSKAPEKFTPGLSNVYAIKADPFSGVWLLNLFGKLALYRDGKLNVTPSRGPPEKWGPPALIVAADHSVLVAKATGVGGWRDGKVQTLALKNGLPCLNVDSLVMDLQQTLWLYTDCGVVSIPNSEMQRWWQDPEAKLKVRVFDVLDGAEISTPILSPASAMSTDGKLWFANGTALQMIDPLHLPSNPLAPPVHIEGMIADRKIYALRDALQLPALTRDIEIDYTALSFPIPQRVRFRYRLDGRDKDWQDAETRRQAFYTSLGPGTYTFHVIACNNDGVWNETGAAQIFTISPAYYQTRWFEIVCAAASAGILWLFYLMRLRRATAQIQERLGAKLEERERIARELHDTLLQSVQGLVLRFQAEMYGLPEREPARLRMEQVLDRADEVLIEGREQVRDLREQGMTQRDLPELLARCGKELAESYGDAFMLTVVGTPETLDQAVGMEVYRIVREAMTNAFQHAEATKIDAELTYDPRSLRVTLCDDGCGIEPTILNAGKPGHWGLPGMRERAAKIGAQLEILSEVGRGTEVNLSIPSKLAYPGLAQHSVANRFKQFFVRMARLWHR
jgi:signal transduction histidine kinase/ligand-binding sensor domain-containing protein